MKKIIVIGLSLALGITLNLGASVSQAAGKAPYKIGRILPLTGYASWVGVLAEEGTALQAEMINKAGGVNGHPIEFVTYDSQSKPEEATRGAHRLISRDGVQAIVGDREKDVDAGDVPDAGLRDRAGETKTGSARRRS